MLTKKNRMKLKTPKNLPPGLGSSGGISDSAAKVLNFLSEVSADSILSQEEITEEVQDEMFINKLDDSGINQLTLATDQILKEAMASKSPKVQRMYTNYQAKWFNFMKRYGVEDYLDETAMIAFFQELQRDYKPGTLWVIYSCINSWYVMNKKVNLNSWPRLRLVLKNFSEMYVAKKASTFTAKQVEKAIRTYEKAKDPRDYLKGVVIMLSYFGLLRMSDLLKVQKRDVSYDNVEKCWKVVFNYPRKRKNPGFTYLIPKQYNDYMKNYYLQCHDIPKCKTRNPNYPSRFVRNWNVKSKKRLQNCGESNIAKMAGETAVMLGLPNPDTFSNHSWRRSAATNLADAGVSKTNLKRHGQWSSDATVEGYIAQSRPLRLERVNKLQPQDDSSEKEWEEDVTDDRKMPAKHSGLTQVDHLSSDEEAVLEQDSEGEPITTIKKKTIEEYLPFRTAGGAPLYSNCTVHVYYKGGDQTNKKKFKKLKKK